MALTASSSASPPTVADSLLHPGIWVQVANDSQLDCLTENLSSKVLPLVARRLLFHTGGLKSRPVIGLLECHLDSLVTGLDSSGKPPQQDNVFLAGKSDVIRSDERGVADQLQSVLFTSAEQGTKNLQQRIAPGFVILVAIEHLGAHWDAVFADHQTYLHLLEVRSVILGMTKGDGNGLIVFQFVFTKDHFGSGIPMHRRKTHPIMGDHAHGQSTVPMLAIGLEKAVEGASESVVVELSRTNFGLNEEFDRQVLEGRPGRRQGCRH